MDASLNAALSAHRAGRLDEAERAYRILMESGPADADPVHLLGFLLHQRGRSEEGLALIERAVALAAEVPLYHANRGEVLLSLGRRDEAEAALRRALALNPGFTPARTTLCKILNERGESEEVLMVSDLGPGTAAGSKLLINRAVAFMALNRWLEAHSCLRDALQGDAGQAAAWTNLGTVRRNLGDWPEALACYRRSLELDPSLFTAYSNMVFTRLYDPGASGADLLAEGRWWEAHNPAPVVLAPPPVARDPEKRLRVGYVSPDFKEHAVMFFFEPLLVGHDRGRVEVFCYSGTTRPDGLTGRLKGLADHWRDILGMDDRRLAELIRADGIDILVDLAGHTAGNRLQAMGLRPAPVQVSLVLAYGATTGLSWIDCILTDDVITPPGYESHFSEEVVRLPGAFAAFQPRETWPEVTPLPEGPPVFGCFTDPARIDGAQVQLWRRVLDALPGSRILFKNPSYDSPGMTEYWRRLFGLLGDQAIFEGVPDGWGAGMEAYGRVSIMLDSWPASGTSSTMIMLWMGLPVVTLAGRHSNQRLSAAILSAIGLADLAPAGGDDYVGAIVGLARDRSRLASLRSGMRERLRASPLLDGPANARATEAAYRAMWRKACGV